MKTLREALDFLAEQPDIPAYLESRGMLNLLPAVNRCYACPVAQYLTAETGNTCWMGLVYAGIEGDSGDAYTVAVPAQVTDFVNIFDKEWRCAI